MKIIKIVQNRKAPYNKISSNSLESTFPSEYIETLKLKEYMLHLLNNKKISFSYQKQVISAIKFYFEKILRRETKSYYFEIPKLKERKLPVVLSKNEVSLFFSKIKKILLYFLPFIPLVCE